MRVDHAVHPPLLEVLSTWSSTDAVTAEAWLLRPESFPGLKLRVARLCPGGHLASTDAEMVYRQSSETTAQPMAAMVRAGFVPAADGDRE
jgi:hypothetical protein